MDKIWDRKSFEVEGIGRCGGDEKNERPRRSDKNRTLKKIKKNIVNVYKTYPNMQLLYQMSRRQSMRCLFL